jgi:penicillin-binding protein 1A
MDKKAEQYFPTYRFNPKYRDVVLAELETALSIANDQAKHYGVMANILLAVLAVAVPAVLQLDKPEHLLSFLQEHPVLGFSLVASVSLILLRYFSELQKQIVFNARKVVTLRLMLGLDYGSIHLTLPNWRVEGATNPFAIRLFQGWFSFGSVPFWTLLVFNGAAIWYALIGTCFRPMPFIILWALFLLWFFRYILLDRHETTRLVLAKGFASLLGLRLVDNFEYVLYRAKLAVIELDRLKVDYSAMRTILVNIEDRRFHEHNGVDWRAMLRALVSRFPFGRKRFRYIRSGGSTIAMQLVRTLFIVHGQPRWKRKLLELVLAPWIAGQFTKADLLNMHIASVRYAAGVMGLSKAVTHYFGKLKGHRLSSEEALLLVERLSNISGKVDMGRVEHLKTRAQVPIDEQKLKKLYSKI